MTEFFDKDDSTLVQLTLLGKETAYEELVTRHERAVKGTAYKITGNTYSAEDASQDAFVSAWMNLSALREPEKFGSWVCSIAKNHARTLVRHYHSAVPQISLHELEYMDLSDEAPEWLAGTTENEDLHAAVEALSEKIREAIKLHYFEDLSVKQIAQRLGVAEGTVKWRLSEGRKQLRKGYGMTEKTYNENETLVARVMRQVEQLQLWRLKNDKTGFEEAYRAVLAAIDELEDSREKSYALAETLRLGYWWIPGEENEETLARIRQAALDGHNDDVMSLVALKDHDKLSGQEKIDFMRDTQIPYYRENGFPETAAYVSFWMGYAYLEEQRREEAIEAFRQVLEIVPPTDVYYATAKAAIYGESRALENLSGYRPNVSATGELFRYINGRLYFWMQPGYGGTASTKNHCIFWNAEHCDSLIYSPELKVGETVFGGKGTSLTCLRTDGACDTPAGHFEGCTVYVCESPDYGYTETWFCPGVGIVHQIVKRRGEEVEWGLGKYVIYGGEGVIPFAPGNRWEYTLMTPDIEARYERENVFEVTGFDGTTATVAATCCVKSVGYYDTCEGKLVEARQEYAQNVSEDESRLMDVREASRRAVELAQTPRQKAHATVADQVMQRIFETDPEFNPDHTQIGRWNFFTCERVERGDRIRLHDDRKYSFEWKNMDKPDDIGYRVLYSFFDELISDTVGCTWSEEWVPGYGFEEKTVGRAVIKDFLVSGGETVTTPAGTFEDCRHISFYVEKYGIGYFKGRSDYWFAPGVGIVKFMHPYRKTFMATWQLTDYRGVGQGYFPVEDGLFRRYEPDELGNGWHASLEHTYVVDEQGATIFHNALGNQDRDYFEKQMK